MRELVTMSADECEQLLRAGGVGRVAVTDGSGPHILPVNYAVVDAAVVVRTAADSILAAMWDGDVVAFEVDQVDHTTHQGWSVLIRARVEWLVDADQIAHVDSVWQPRPWASGDRPLYLRLAWTSIEGRRIGSGWDLQHALPVRRSL